MIIPLLTTMTASIAHRAYGKATKAAKGGGGGGEDDDADGGAAAPAGAAGPARATREEKAKELLPKPREVRTL